MAERRQRRTASFRGLCLFVMVAAIFGVPIGAFIGIESSFDTPLPIEQTLHRKVIAKRVMFSAGGIALGAAVGLYLIDRQRQPGP
jgi:hypothetical protein